jgi:thiosulfate reductase cytochrome b subunit
MPSFFNTWLPFIYLYVVGGLFFITGLIIAVKSGSLNKQIPRHRKWFWLLIFGYCFFFILHALLITAALYW